MPGCGTAFAPSGTKTGRCGRPGFRAPSRTSSSQPGRLRPRRAHHAHARRHGDRHQGQARDRADQDDDLAARAGRGRDLRRGLHRPLLRLPGKAQRHMGHCAAPPRLRERPARPGRSVGQVDARPRRCWRGFPKATGTSPICRPRSATRSNATCPGSTGRSSTRSMPRARHGSRARSCDIAQAQALGGCNVVCRQIQPVQ